MKTRYAAGLALVVTDRSQVAGDRTLLDVVAAALEGGARGVIVRERDLPDAEREELVAQVRRLAKPYGALVPLHLRRGERFEVNAPTDPLREHLDPVGRSCHDLDELRRACDDRLDHVTLSPVALTASKPGYGPALGVAGLRDLTSAIRAERDDVPTILALGGVTHDNAGYWVEAGADGVAVMGEIMRADDPAATMRAIVESVSTARELA